MDDQSILQVALPVPLPQCFDYLPILDQPLPKIGARVQVHFGRRTLVGWVTAILKKSTIPTGQLKRVSLYLDEEPLFPADLWELGQYVQSYYHPSPGDVFTTVLPKALRQGKALPVIDHAVMDSILNPNAVLPVLTQEQSEVLSQLHDQQGFRPFLLMGVTGSGKTEVYLRAIERVLEQGKTALVLVPEIGLTPQTIKRFEDRFHVPVVAMHSDMTDKARLIAFAKARIGEARILIGTRSAIFSPMQQLGIIVVDEEHDPSFKQHQTGLRYSARDLAVWRAKINNIPVILGSATPSLESWQNAQQDRYGLLLLTQRPRSVPMPKMHAVNLRNQPLQAGLAPETIQTIDQHLKAKKQVLIFLNRRGYSPVLLCHACGEVMGCKRCDARLTYHQYANKLRCHHCEHERPKPRICPACRQAELITVGVGTEQLEIFLTQTFSQAKILRIDRDTTSKKNSFAEKMERVEHGDVDILIGTQMLAKGHHFANVSLSVIVDVDSGLLSSDFRAMERMAQLILQVAGRAGRESEQGEVILQTHQVDHPVLMLLLEKGYGAFAAEALKDRAMMHLPPFTYFAILKAEAHSVAIPTHFLQSVKALVNAKTKTVRCLGPVPALMEKKAGKYRSHLLLQAESRSALQKLLSQTTSQIQSLETASRVRWVLDVDPLEVL